MSGSGGTSSGSGGSTSNEDCPENRPQEGTDCSSVEDGCPYGGGSFCFCTQFGEWRCFGGGEGGMPGSGGEGGMPGSGGEGGMPGSGGEGGTPAVGGTAGVPGAGGAAGGG
jgi:hypothetical protein